MMNLLTANKQELALIMGQYKLPHYMVDGMYLYLKEGIEPGSFMCSVLENDLVHSFGRADHNNRAVMFGWASFLYNDMPAIAWGSREKVKKFMQLARNKKFTPVK